MPEATVGLNANLISCRWLEFLSVNNCFGLPGRGSDSLLKIANETWKVTKSILDLFSDSTIDCEKWIFQRHQRVRNSKFIHFYKKVHFQWSWWYLKVQNILIFSWDQNVSALHNFSFLTSIREHLPRVPLTIQNRKLGISTENNTNWTSLLLLLFSISSLSASSAI